LIKWDIGGFGRIKCISMDLYLISKDQVGYKWILTRDNGF